MESEFYHIEEQNLNIKLNKIISFKLDSALKGLPHEHLKCCIVLPSNSVFWCNKEHYFKLCKLFNIKHN